MGGGGRGEGPAVESMVPTWMAPGPLPARGLLQRGQRDWFGNGERSLGPVKGRLQNRQGCPSSADVWGEKTHEHHAHQDKNCSPPSLGQVTYYEGKKEGKGDARAGTGTLATHPLGKPAPTPCRGQASAPFVGVRADVGAGLRTGEDDEVGDLTVGVVDGLGAWGDLLVGGRRSWISFPPKNSAHTRTARGDDGASRTPNPNQAGGTSEPLYTQRGRWGPQHATMLPPPPGSGLAKGPGSVSREWEARDLDDGGVEVEVVGHDGGAEDADGDEELPPVRRPPDPRGQPRGGAHGEGLGASHERRQG